MTAGELFSVAGRVAVVTGGNGQLGAQYARVLLANGAKVAVLDVGFGNLERPLRPEIAAGRLLLVDCDITRKLRLRQALSRVRRALGSPTILVNNAALDSPPGAPAEENGPFEGYPERSWDRVNEVNLKGMFLTCQIFGGHMARAGLGGSIINISSIYGNVSPDQSIYAYRARGGRPFFKPVAYSVTKAGVLNLTRYLATYWAGKGVRVNTLTLAGVFNNQDRRFLRGYLKKVPLGRMACADEYNGAVVFLASDASRYMTGANLVVDGGWLAW